MKNKKVLLLSCAVFLTCACATQKTVVKETAKTDKQDITQTETYKEYYKAAKKGDPEAQFKIGSEYADFYTDYFDTEKAEKWLLKAAKQNYAPAQFKLAKFYDSINYGRDIRDKEAFKWYLIAAENGNTEAYQKVADFYNYSWKRYGVKQNKQKALEYYLKVPEAERVSSVINERIADLYSDEGDYKNAFEWYLKAAEQGNELSQIHLGHMYYNGQGVKQDYQKAFEWYLKAAEQWNYYAQFNLAVMYYDGQGVKQDYQKAFEWYSKAAERGHHYAQYYLAGMYYNGEGIKQDLSKAFEWYEKVAKQDDEKVQALISCYDKNMKTPQEHFNKCLSLAGQGSAQAQYAVGVLYAQELGVKKDLQKAYEWISKAAAQDGKYEESKKYIEEELAKISDKNGI